MRTSPKIQLKVQPKLQLAPQVRQALGLMQLSRLELIDHIKQTVEENPLLDLEFDDPKPAEVDFSNASNHQSHPSAANDIDQWASETVSLRAHLIWQANLVGLDRRDHALALVLIDHIDEDGLLRATKPEILAHLAQTEPELKITLDDITRVLHQIQQFEPMGVGAQSVSESLAIQLDAKHGQDKRHALAKRLVFDHLDALGQEDPQRLATALGVSSEEIQQSFHLIQSLDPHPANRFGNWDGAYIIPDVYAYPASSDSTHSKWSIVLNPSYLPRVSMNDTYQALIGQAKGSDQAYLDDKLQQAKTLLGAIALRDLTLVRVTEALIRHQHRFFKNQVSSLQPLTQSALAVQLGVHASTVSRATSNKYVQTPKGLMELKALFCGRIDHESGTAVSTEAVKSTIQALIDGEDGKAPLSDQTIAAHLRGKGVKIARRTVAKYRRIMGISGSKHRRNQKLWFDQASK